MGRPVKKVEAALEERVELRNRVRASTTPQRDSLRARIILLRLRGEKAEEVARRLGVSVACVSKWTSRFETLGLEGLKDLQGRGRKPSLPKEKVDQVLTQVTQRRKDVSAGACAPWPGRWEFLTTASIEFGRQTTSS